MDRLSLVILVLASLGCDGARTEAAPAPGRVVAVSATETDPEEELCDVAPEGEAALTYPALAEGDPPSSGRATWVNVWATWCRPCVEEMPLLHRFQQQLADEGVEVDLVFLSADRDAEAVAAFRQAHPETPAGPRVADPEAIAPWAEGVGLAAGGSLPIHVFTDARGRVRCARGGAVSERDYEAVRGVLRGM